MTVKQLIKELEKIENKNLKIELKVYDWKAFYIFWKWKFVYDNSKYTWSVIITTN